MNELFRFVVLRPAAPVRPERKAPVQASSELVKVIREAGSAPERVRVLAQRPVFTQWSDYRFAQALSQLGTWAVRRTPWPEAPEIEQQLKHLVGETAAVLSDDDAFQRDLRQLDDTLVTLKYRCMTPPEADVDAWRNARVGYDLVLQLAQGQVPVRRQFELASALPDVAPPPRPAPAPQPPDPARAERLHDLDRRIEAIDHARQSLREAMRGEPAAVKVLESESPAPALSSVDLPAALGRTPPAPPVRMMAPRVSSPWLLRDTAVHAFSKDTQHLLGALAGNPLQTPSVALSARLGDAHAQLLREKAELLQPEPALLKKVGSNWYASEVAVSQYGALSNVGQLAAATHIRPVGVGDLLIVRQHLKRYESDEVAHIENILRSEKLSRDTRRLERTETTNTTETQTDKEEERDTQSTDRFSLKRETENTVKTDAQVKAGLSVDAKYGPFVEVKADLQGSYQHQTQEVTKQTSEFSKDVVSRSVSKLVTKVRELQTTVALKEWEEKYSHGFDNTAPGAAHVSGVYQFVDKVSEAQIYNYGKRLMFDVMVPEPAAFYIWAQQRNTAAQSPLQAPAPFNITPSSLNVGNYQIHAKAYGATGIDPPPPEHRTVSQAWDVTIAADPHLYSKSGTIALDDGYAAIHAAAVCWYNYPTDKSPAVGVMVGSQSLNLTASGWGSVALSGEEGSLAVGLFCASINSATVTLEILCERTARAMDVWQEKAYAAIAQAYQQKLSDYQHALAELKTAMAFAVTGRNPEANTAVVVAELRKACIEQLTLQHFDQFGAIGTDTGGRPQLDLGRVALQGPYIRFFEEAFEWERIVYFFYPYFWASKATWAQRSLLDDFNDPDFADFLRAGAARVVFPVRPGFETAIVHYLETGLIWNGGDPPDISSSLYLPIVQEIAEAQQRPGNEVPVGDPWEVRLPTQLVKLRPDDTLPRWKKDALGEWVTDN